MKAEYDFSKGTRGKFYHPNAVFGFPVYLEPDVDDFVSKLAEEQDIDIQKLVNEWLVVKLTWQMDLGIEGEDSEAANPLSRSLNCLFEDGQPFKRLTQCFLSQTSSAEGPEDYKLWWFGVFILSRGNRVIFFPGLKRTKDQVQAYKGKHLEWDQEFEVDHISLEKDRTRWHITGRRSRHHLGSIRTADLGAGRRLWFGMSISDFSALWPVSQRTTVVAKCPASDVDRRVEVFKEARNNAQFHIIEPHPDANKRFRPGFFHVSVIIGPSGFEIYKGENHGFPEGSPFLTQPLPEQILRMPVRYHQVSLSDDIDMQITTAKLPGALRVPVTFTVNEEPNKAMQPTR